MANRKADRACDQRTGQTRIPRQLRLWLRSGVFLTAKTYKPKPQNTSRVRLSRAMKNLIEELARNTHEVWAKERIAQGWKYGPKRDDARKQHPSLVPYEKLTKKEKAFDQKTAGEVIKVLLAMGYRIEKP
jgi:hypothetical protein